MTRASDANPQSANLDFAHTLAEVASDVAVEPFGSGKSQTLLTSLDYRPD